MVNTKTDQVGGFIGHHMFDPYSHYEFDVVLVVPSSEFSLQAHSCHICWCHSHFFSAWTISREMCAELRGQGTIAIMWLLAATLPKARTAGVPFFFSIPPLWLILEISNGWNPAEFFPPKVRLRDWNDGTWPHEQPRVFGGCEPGLWVTRWSSLLRTMDRFGNMWKIYYWYIYLG